MALIVPDYLPLGVSQGEKILYQILSDKLPDDFYIWYEPSLQGYLPYFTILAPEFGLLIIEVMSWYSHQILSADSHNLTIKSQIKKPEITEVQQSSPTIPARRTRKRNRVIIEVQQSPLQQVHRYFLDQLLDKIQAYHILSQPDSESPNKLAFPVGIGVVMPNITATQFREKNLYNFLSELQVIYREELLSWNEISEVDLVNRLKRMFTNRFDFLPLTPDQIETIKGLLYATALTNLVSEL